MVRGGYTSRRGRRARQAADSARSTPRQAESSVLATDGRVYLRPPRSADQNEFISLMQASSAFHRPWASAPTNEERFLIYLSDAGRPDFEAMLLCRCEDDAILGFLNLSHITRGALQSAYLGYAIGSPFARQGFMRDGLELVLRHAFLDLHLHRIEANIQPGNHASIALARGAGFRREGFSRRYLKIGGRWRDHERWAILVDDWQARAANG
ncbi:MAG: GNAT family N-acetyltransferase [Solirubrobacterales bacterium]|nr:GNAT family N-acetyltransferase [Solirubrobacterales bacterium]MBV9165869.1 GNAT family N-acetyltransferase [Solirubrobacterales bacterium]MBV9533973.1 GNAT family N-acetyltransferase [Solirubrobacterales bacterium]